MTIHIKSRYKNYQVIKSILILNTDFDFDFKIDLIKILTLNSNDHRYWKIKENFPVLHMTFHT